MVTKKLDCFKITMYQLIINSRHILFWLECSLPGSVVINYIDVMEALGNRGLAGSSPHLGPYKNVIL